MVRHGTLDSLMEILFMSDFIICYTCDKSWELQGQCTVTLYEAVIVCLRRENSADIRDLIKTKLQLYIDDSEL